MALGPSRVTKIVESPFPHERAGLRRLQELLPDVDPYHLWTNALLVEGSRSYEIDAIAIGKHCIYLIELKAWEGEIRGDLQDWYVLKGGRETYHPNPYRLAETKAKVLKSLLQARLKKVEVPWVEPLVYLHGADVKLRMDEPSRKGIVVGDAIGHALTHRDYPGKPAYSGAVINRPLMEAIKRGIQGIGLKASEKNNRVGEYRILGQLEDGDLYQDLLVQRPDLGGKEIQYRLRVFPAELEPEGLRREQLERAAVREERTLREVSGHPYVLKAESGIASPRGPAIPMEYLPDAVTLFAWVEAHPGAGMALKLRLIQQIAEAVSHCHSRKVIHRNLSPAAVLVTGGDVPEVRLRNFGFAHRLGGAGTLTGSVGQGERERLYRAPEVFVASENANDASDVFSLGAIAFFVLTGKDPARDLKERGATLDAHEGLRVSLLQDGFTERSEAGDGRAIDDVIYFATHRDPSYRFSTATDFLNELFRATRAPEPLAVEEVRPKVDPLAAKPGEEIADGLVVEHLLGSGATSIVYLVKQGEYFRVLKVARDSRANEFLLGEARTLEKLKHQRIVSLKQTPFMVEGHGALLLDMAGETTLAQYLRDEGSVGLDFAARWGRELIETVQFLEEKGVFHRDIKPPNIGLEVIGKNKPKSILLFDFSHSHLDPRDIESGTEAYRDPHLSLRGRWDSHAELYSTALVLYEMLTGTLPRRPRTPDAPAVIAPDSLIESCRDGLTEFFRRALSVKVEDRFPSASELLQAWKAATEPRTKEERVARPIHQVKPETPVFELPLSESALNTLGRNRIETAGDLAKCSRNRLLILKGVGRKVAQELDGLASTLRDQFQLVEATPLPEPFVADYLLEPRALLDLRGLPISAEVLDRLVDAGIATDVELARHSAAELGELFEDEAALDDVRRYLEKQRKSDTAPPNLAGWVAEAQRGLPRAKNAKKDRTLLSQLLGLEPFGTLGPTKAPSQVELARATEGCSQGKLSRLLLAARYHWTQSHLSPRFVHRLARFLHLQGGALPLPLLAQRFGQQLTGFDGSDMALRQVSFLIRVACETSDGDRPPVRRRVLKSGVELIEAVEDMGRELMKLAAIADKLADSTPLPSVQRALATIEAEVERLDLLAMLEASPPPGAALPDEPAPDRSPSFWLRLACDLSSRAALSRRGEVYPRDLEPARLLELLGPSLAPEFTPAELAQQVRERYPDASTRLPDGEPLRELLARRRYVWDEANGTFRRRGEPIMTQRTSGPSRPTSPGSPLRLLAPRLDAASLKQEHTTDRLVAAARERSFRALMVAPHRVELAVQRLRGLLEGATGKRPREVSVDLGLARALRGVLAEEFPDQPDLWFEVLRADAGGPDVPAAEHESWEELGRFAERAGRALLDELRSEAEPGVPLVLRDLGLVARYGLTGFLEELGRIAEADDHLGTVFLVVPQTEAAASPRINDVLEVPVTPGQALRLHKEWVQVGDTGQDSRAVADASPARGAKA